jgi:hypothetical protein
MTEKDPPTTEPRSAASSLFDLRTVIAGLFGVYGVILTLLGLFGGSPEELAKSGGVDLNLWTGIGMLIVSGIFVTWQRLRPTITA